MELSDWYDVDHVAIGIDLVTGYPSIEMDGMILHYAKSLN